MGARPRLSQALQVALRTTVTSVSPVYFTICMGVGGVAQTFGALPYDIPGRLGAGFAFYLLDALLFAAFSLLFIARLALYPRRALPFLLTPASSIFLGAIPIALSTLNNGIILVVHPLFPNTTGGFAGAATAMWWCQAVLAILCVWGVALLFLSTQHKRSMDQMTAAWIFPVLPGLVASASGGVVAAVTPPGQAYHIVLVSGVLWGATVPLAFMLMTLFAPYGMAGYALLTLSKAARSAFEPGLAAALSTGGAWVALALWGSGIFWLWLALVAVGSRLRWMNFNIGWWAFVFPSAVLTGSTGELAQRFDSQGFRVLTAVLSVATLVLFSIAAAGSLWTCCSRAWRWFSAACTGAEAEDKANGLVARQQEPSAEPSIEVLDGPEANGGEGGQLRRRSLLGPGSVASQQRDCDASCELLERASLQHSNALGLAEL